MTNFPNASDEAVRSLFDLSKDNLFNLTEQLKIENLSEEFLAEIVIPISSILRSDISKMISQTISLLFVLRGDIKTMVLRKTTLIDFIFFIQKILTLK